jgi:hypothetical protein
MLQAPQFPDGQNLVLPVPAGDLITKFLVHPEAVIVHRHDVTGKVPLPFQGCSAGFLVKLYRFIANAYMII